MDSNQAVHPPRRHRVSRLGANTMNYTEVAQNWNLWIEYVDTDATMTRAEFDALSVEQKVQMQIDAFGPDEDEEQL